MLTLGYFASNISHVYKCCSTPEVAKVVDIDPLESMGLSKGSIKAQGSNGSGYRLRGRMGVDELRDRI
ncbi:hypothetical protein T09_14940 [Trichinella sp. T9]|nr:hypothetical protein T09_14940 [Trichinella sp. T9]